uniref:AAA family ATPase n=1 Tax=Otariodibacter sp. TaxID=3030919 RepID=UPI002614B0A0
MAKKQQIKGTLLKSMTVKNFRNMSDVSFEFGSRITVISGKNGTAKSTILGLVAQIFNFDKDVINDKKLDFKTLNDKPFKSQFSEHFRLSDQFDKPGEMDVRYNIYDAYFKKDINDLRLTLTDTEGRKHRTVVRNNLPTPHSKNTSRNVTHPVIYLSLKRLLPIPNRDGD